MKFQEFAQKVLESQRYKASTLSTYTSLLQTHINPAIGEMDLKLIKKMDLDRLQTDMVNHGHAVRANMVVSVLRKIFSEAVCNDEIERSPAAALKTVAVEMEELSPLSMKEIRKALDHVDVHYQPIFYFLTFTGCRPNEALGLKWEDINFEDDIIRIRNGRVGKITGTPKTKSGIRKIYLPSDLKDQLQALHDCVVRSPKDFVFLGFDGEPLNGSHLSRVWRRALESAGLQAQKAYGLRHAFISNAVQSGIDLTYVARIAGHKNVNTTLSRYNHLLDEKGAAQQAKLEKLLEK